MHNYFPKVHQVRNEAENGGKKESMVILGRFFCTSRNQLDSYYHLALLMSLVGKTKLQSIPQQTALWSSSGESLGSVEHLKIHLKVFCLL